MPLLTNNLALDRCPHCHVSHPNLPLSWATKTANSEGRNIRNWNCYVCTVCGGMVVACAGQLGGHVDQYFPIQGSIDKDLPPRAQEFLKQATESAPVGAVMCAASAVDAMLKAANYKEGSLYERIDKAAKEHVITNDMATWAHEVRLDANDQRHADDAATISTPEDAERVIAFTKALGQFMFVIPAKVQRGIQQAKT